MDMFMALGLFEEGIGPDRFSDMTTNIILDDLIAFTKRVNVELCLPVANFKENKKEFVLPANPFSNKPLLLVPDDIVRDLPIAKSFGDIARAARENEDLRERVNGQIGEIWASMDKKQKKALKQNALRSKKSFDTVIELIRKVPPEPYDLDADRNGELFWMELRDKIANDHPIDLSAFEGNLRGLSDVKSVVDQILFQFRELVEDKGLWKELWADENKPRKEKAAQRLFYAVADSYCKANNLDLTPESDSGNGPVDFKLSRGTSKVVIEIKLSTNPNVLHGFEKQLEIYKKAENTDVGVFLLIDVGFMKNKFKDVQVARQKFLDEFGQASDIWLVDGNQKASASKRK